MAIKGSKGAGPDQPPPDPNQPIADREVGDSRATPRDVTIPIDVGMFTSVSVLESLQHRYAIPSFIRDTFFTGRDYVASDFVQIDSKKGGRGLAPFVLPLEGQVIGRRRPFIRTVVEAPILAPARVITLREAGRPYWGENPYNFNSPEQRIAQMYADDTDDMDAELARTEEWMCCETMFNGFFDITYRTATPQRIDYGFTNITAVALPWTDPTSNPLGDLQLAQEALNAEGYAGNIAIYGTKAWAALWNNPNVQALMKNTVGFVPISGNSMGESLPAGVARAPSFTYPIMQNYVYSGSYARGGVNTRLVPEDRVLIASSDVKNRIVYAIVTQIEQSDNAWHSYMSDRVPKVEVNVNKNLHMYTLTSRPLPIPNDLMSWTVLDGVLP